MTAAMNLSRPMTLSAYARHRGISYQTAWRHLKKGCLQARKRKDGIWVLTRQVREVQKGRPQVWDRAKVAAAVYRLCRGRYIRAVDFPSSLYKLCKKYCGSVRAAKWEAKVLHGRTWTRRKFLKCVRQFCVKRYREDRDWPVNMRQLAKQHCGSIRKAKWEAGVILDPRSADRLQQGTAKLYWDRAQVLRWLKGYCKGTYRKPAFIPGHMRSIIVRHFGTVRSAKYAAGILKDVRGAKPRLRGFAR